jgi:hypothetical protein
MDKSIMDRVREHYEEALEYFPEDRIVGIFLQGSQNYGLQVPNSDVDTKLIVVPTFEDIAMNRKAVSTTHLRANEEHIDFKDIRLMFQTFRKQNLNFLEILFTDYKIINPLYADLWYEVEKYREEIAHYNLYSAVKAMKGIALEKYHAMEHEYPSKLEVLAKYGYDPKQLHHLVRVEDYLERYISGESYVDCLRPTDPKYLIDIKLGKYGLDEAREMAKQALAHIDEICAPFTKDSSYNVDSTKVDCILNTAQHRIMQTAVMEELWHE